MRIIKGLYAVTPELADTAVLLSQVEAALAGGAAIVQYRNKSSDAGLHYAQAAALVQLCRRYGAPFIVNDNVELARAVGADGVHVGRDDPDLHAARMRLGADKLIGVSCYDELARAERTAAAGANYIAFGSFFPSPIKPAAVPAPLGLLAAARGRIKVPLVAIGGITVANAPRLVAAGADAVAVISSLFDASDITATARQFVKLFENANPHDQP